MAISARRGTRLWSIDELAVLDDERARPIFERALQDDSPQVRMLAEIGLERLANKGPA